MIVTACEGLGGAVLSPGLSSLVNAEEGTGAAAGQPEHPCVNQSTQGTWNHALAAVDVLELAQGAGEGFQTGAQR